MKVHLIKENTLKKYARENASLRAAVRLFLEMLTIAVWVHPGDIKKQFGAADILGNGSCRVVFDIGGNNCRMICKYKFGIKKVHLYVKWIGTHRDYDELCRKGFQYTIDDY